MSEWPQSRKTCSYWSMFKGFGRQHDPRAADPRMGVLTEARCGIRQVYAETAARVAPVIEMPRGDWAGGPILGRKQAFPPCRVTRCKSPRRTGNSPNHINCRPSETHVAYIQGLCNTCRRFGKGTCLGGGLIVATGSEEKDCLACCHRDLHPRINLRLLGYIIAITYWHR